MSVFLPDLNSKVTLGRRAHSLALKTYLKRLYKVDQPKEQGAAANTSKFSSFFRITINYFGVYVIPALLCILLFLHLGLARVFKRINPSTPISHYLDVVSTLLFENNKKFRLFFFGETFLIRLIQIVTRYTLYYRSLKYRLANLQEFSSCGKDCLFAIIGEDNPLSLDFALISKFRDKGVRVGVLPYTTGVHEEFLRSFKNNQNFIRKVETLFMKAMFAACDFPLKNDSLLTLYRPLEFFYAWKHKANLSCLELGFTGIADYYFLDNLKTYNTYKSIPEISGKVMLVEAVPITEQLSNIFAFDLSKSSHLRNPQIAIFLPPDQNLNRITKSEWSATTYEGFLVELIQFIQRALPSKTKLHFFLHPRSSSYYNYLHESLYFKNNVSLKKANLPKRFTAYTSAILFESAIIRYLEYLRIPTLSWDIYGYGYNSLVTDKINTIRVTNKQEFSQLSNEHLLKTAKHHIRQKDRFPELHTLITEILN